MNHTEKKRKFLINAAYYLLIAAILYGILKYATPIFLPFILGFLIVWILRKPTLWLTKKTRIPVKISGLLVLIVFYAVFFSLILYAGTQIFSSVREFVPRLPSLYSAQLLPAINTLSDLAENALSQFDPAFVAGVEYMFQQLTVSLEELITTLSSWMMQVASNLILGMPSFFIRLLLMVISSFFLAGDYDRVMGFFYQHLPERYQNTLKKAKSKLTGSLWIYIRSYTILLLVTFCELLIGLSILKIPYAPFIATFIALFDLMPILGTGGILIPWAFIAACLGEYSMAIGIGILYLVITAVRNTLEPRLVGKQIGLHPLATLISLFLGSQLFGIVGLFGLPVTLSVLVQLQRGDTAETNGIKEKTAEGAKGQGADEKTAKNAENRGRDKKAAGENGTGGEREE